MSYDETSRSKVASGGDECGEGFAQYRCYEWF
jgi:hypothetical protein